MTTTTRTCRRRPCVTATPPASSVLAARHFQWRLTFETDPADVHADLERGVAEFTLVDTRSREAFVAGHIPGAVSLPYAEIDETTTAVLPRDRPVVTYCSSSACNAAAKSAAALAALGYQVKEMLGGVEHWQREGYQIETSESHTA
jgi:rhodanese-related sulfurtransferase